MGDRGNIKIYQYNHLPIYLYTHWRGSEIYGILKRTLARRERWDDECYLARMIFAEMIKGDEAGSTGFGIATYICNNEHTILGVDCEKQRVTFEEEDGYVKSSVSFEDFVNRQDKWST